VVIGLGNPGPRYEGTRHNVGFAVAERLASSFGLRWRRSLFRRFAMAAGRVQGERWHIFKPMTFMNASGEALAPMLRAAKASLRDALVVCDSLDLPPGVCRLRVRGSSGGQRGLESIIRHAGTGEFARLVVGIGRPASRADVVSHVLGRPGPDEASALQAAVERAAAAVSRIPREGVDRVMNEINRTA
jgi:PTH1 family peptidyl-tRNA hydrolase